MEVGLRQDVQEHPDDDGVRLVYADWLEEHGEAARAEFLRVDCERERLDEDDPRRHQLEDRRLELLGDHRAAWLAGLPTWEGCAWEFRRGLVAAVRITPEA